MTNLSRFAERPSGVKQPLTPRRPYRAVECPVSGNTALSH